MNSKKMFVVASVAALALGLTACGGPNDAGDASADPSPVETSAPDTSASGENSDTASKQGSNSVAGDVQAALDAIAAAEREAGGVAYAIDDEDGNTSWQVDVLVDERTVEVEIDAEGEVVGTEDDDIDADEAAVITAAKTTLSEAIETAAAQVSGEFEEAELDDEDDTAVWEVSFSGDEDIKVDISTGEIIK